MDYLEIEPENNRHFRTIFVDLTHKCNMSCSNCYIPNRNIPDMDTSKLYEFASKLPKPVTFRLIGGEPTLRKDIFDIIFNLRKLKHQTTLFTNGLLLSNNDMVRSLKQSGLNRIQLSMNGGSLNEVYRITDNMPAAQKKISALQNIIKNEIVAAVGMIVVNEKISAPAIQSLIPLIEDTYLKYAPRKNKSILIPSLRFRSIAKIGRFLDNELEFEKLVEIVSSNLTKSLLVFNNSQCGSDYFRLSSSKTNSQMATYQSKVGPLFIKITNWKIDPVGIVDPKSIYRARLTKNWKLAPFFEDIKANENGY